ncbi:MAG: hypothetical protein GY835_03130 [bacterium]|nr:hypothetical protein [bacterium]
MCNRARQNVFCPHGDIVLSNRDPRDIGDCVRDSCNVLDRVCDGDCTCDPGDIFAHVGDPVDVFSHISDTGDILGGVRDPGAIFFSDPCPSLWVTERLKR